MRSTCMRLSSRGKTGPKKTKPYEAVAQLGKYSCNWKGQNMNMVKFIEETLNLMYGSQSAKHLPIKLKCTGCGKSNKFFSEVKTIVNTGEMVNLGPLHIGDILKKLANEDEICECNQGIQSLVNSTDGKMIVLFFSHAISINLNEEVKIFGSAFRYKSHIEELPNLSRKTHFNFNGQIFSQDHNGILHHEQFGVFANVKILSLAIPEKEIPLSEANNEPKHMYDKKK